MKTFTIDNENNITAFGTPEEAAATTTTPFDSFASQKELAELVAQLAGGAAGGHLEQPAGREAGEELQDQPRPPPAGSGSTSRAWAKPAKPKAERKAKGWRTGGQGRARQGQGDQEGHRLPKKAPKAKKAAKAQESAGPREGSKTAQVVAMLQRKNGATLAEIMEKMGWQKHTVRGFMAGAMKKAGYTVESFKSEEGERTYRINQ